jgi:hypothetical protein
MDRNTEVTLDQLYSGIVAAISAKFPDLHVEAEREDRDMKRLPVPCCLVDLIEMPDANDHDPGTGQQAVNATFSAQLIVGFRQDAGKNARKEVRKLAAALAALVRLNRWGCPVGPAYVQGAYPDDFDPDLDQFECWRVDWEQVVHLGETVWTNDGVQPTVVLLGEAPMVGADFVPDYVQVTP